MVLVPVQRGARTMVLALGLALAGTACSRQAAPIVPPPAPPPIVGTSWRAEAIETRPALGEVASTLTFDSSTRASGSAGCNAYTAPVIISGTAVRVGPIKRGRQTCAAEVMDQERRFLAALDAARAYRLEEARLRLLDLRSNEVLRLAPGAPPAGPRGE